MLALATAEEDALGALEALADALGAPAAPPSRPLPRAELPAGSELELDTLAAVVGALLPEGAVVVDESVTASIVRRAHRGRRASTTTCS